MEETPIENVGRQVYLVQTQDYPVERAKSWRYEVRVLAGADSTADYVGKRAYLYLGKDSTRALPNRGDTLLVRTEWRDAGTMGTFDYSRYLRRQGIMGTGYASSHNWHQYGVCQSAPRDGKWLQHILRQRYVELGFSGHVLQTLSAMTLGYKEDLDNDLRERFQRAGAAHLLAVSGLHTGILFAMIMGLLTCFGLRKPYLWQTKRRWVVGCSAIAFIWLYAVITGMSASVTRSAIMLTVLQMGILLRRESVTLNSLLAAGICILVVRPQELWSVGFWLSMMAVAGILLLAVPVQQHLPYYHGPVGKVANYVQGLIVVSVAAQIATLPITLYCFGTTSNYFLITNLLLIPLAGVVIGAGLGSLLLGTVPLIGPIVVKCTGWVVEWTNTVITTIESLPGSVSVIRTDARMMVLLYAAMVFGYLSIKKNNWWLIGVALSMSLWCYLYTII